MTNKILLICVIIFFAIVNTFATDKKEEVKLIYHEKCQIFFADSTALSGYILEKKDSVVEFRKLDDRIVEIKIKDITGIKSLLRYHFGSVGIGLGSTYGFIGINAEYEFLNYFGVFGAVGIYPETSICYGGGLNIYFVSSESSFRPRLLVYYGTNTVTRDYFNDKFISNKGLSAGIGLSLNFGRSIVTGTDFSFQFPIITEKKIDFEIIPTTFYSVGLRLYF